MIAWENWGPLAKPLGPLWRDELGPEASFLGPWVRPYLVPLAKYLEGPLRLSTFGPCHGW